jgi:cell division protease FtsH
MPINEIAQALQQGQVTAIDVDHEDALVTLSDGRQFAVRLEEPGSLPRLVESFGVTPAQLATVRYSVNDTLQLDWLKGGAAALVPLLLIGSLILLGLRGAMKPRDMFQFGKTRARVFEADRPKITFADVAGVDEAKHELAEVVEFLKAPARFTALGARLPRGVLLIGPPGTGKTLLARAVAGEADVPFFNISGSQFVEMFVGVGASRVRDLFEQARRCSPCIVFVDEIDAVGRHRGAGVGGGNDEREQTLNQLLVEMDGFDPATSVIVIAATNRPDVLDQALLRPGRFDRQVQVAAPDVRGREAVLQVHARGKPVDRGVDLVALAQSTPGFSGADLANVLNEAAIMAARRRGSAIAAIDIEEAVDRILAGPAAQSRLMSEPERRLTAYHEAGHAVVARFLDSHDPVHRITIVGRGKAGGYTRFVPSDDRHYQTRSQLAASIASALGGHAAETLVFGEMSTGASSDLERATHLARRMVTDYGMSDMGVVALGSATVAGRESNTYSEDTARQIDEQIRGLVEQAYALARQVIVEQRAVLDRLAHALLRWETLQGAELEQVFADL